MRTRTCPARLTLGLLLVFPLIAAAADAAADQARRILDTAQIQGGLIVHLGCADGRLTAALHAGDAYLVHGLDRDAANVQKARQYIQSRGLYGPVSVERLSGDKLPYADNLVNLVVVEQQGNISTAEIQRVLCPGGVAVTLNAQRSTLNPVRKPWPTQIDDWTHFLHDATNNAVSDDSVVGPPRQLQWVAGPKWTRSHDHLATVSAVVSAGGRLFSIVDEAPTAAVILEPQWRLIARDAFSGVILWKRPIEKWEWHLRGFRSGPSDLSRRLVAVDDRVYVTLGIDAPVSALDAATGKTLLTYEGTEGAREIIWDDGTLFVVVGDLDAERTQARAERRGQHPGLAEVRPQRPAYLEMPPLKHIVALDASSGRALWEKSDADTSELMPTTLAVSRGRVFFQNADAILCLDAKTGKTIWQSDRPTSRSRPTWSAPTLVAYGDVVLSADRAVAQEKTLAPDSQREVEWFVTSQGGQAPVGELMAFSATDGRFLWKCSAQECYNAPIDVLVADGLVWTGNIVTAKLPGVTQARDPRTGEVKRTRPRDQEFFSPGMGHQRCYRNKATNRYLVFGRSGVEFIDVATGKAIPHHWTRGTCQYGVVPCNGLLYVPPHSCACFIRSKLNGFNCFTPQATPLPANAPTPRPGEFWQRGPAFDQVQSALSSLRFRSATADEWPTYRHDAARSGATALAVSAKLKPDWQTDLGGKLSSVVVADGKLLVAQVDAHAVHALDAASGRELWSYTAGGRIDSPPTICTYGPAELESGHEGKLETSRKGLHPGGLTVSLCVFGSADGWVYCLRADDGALVWRFRVAPVDWRIVANGQLESAWPVSGSVLVREEVVYCDAGRSSYLDGGIRLCRLDLKTGRYLSETIVDDRDPETGYQRQGVVRGTNMPGALPDVLSCDGESVFMRHRRFDLWGHPQDPNVPHLFSAAGFLDDAWWHRTYWFFGTLMGTNYGGWPNPGNRVPAGRLLALDSTGIYGFGRNQYIHHGAHIGIDGATVFHFRPDRDASRRFTYYQAFAIDRAIAGAPAASAEQSAQRSPSAAKGKVYRWAEKLPILARALALTKDKVLLAGPPDILTSDDPAGTLTGHHGGQLCVVATQDGTKLSQTPLPSPPVLDGMAVANSSVYLATTSGQVVCYHAED